MEKTQKDIFYVAVQMILFVAFIAKPDFLNLNLGIGIRLLGSISFVAGMFIVLLAIIQLNRNLTVFPTPKRNSNLVQSGLYKYIRHPIYTGVILVALGFGLYSESAYRLIIGLLLFVLFYFKSKYEEERLKKVFPEYPEYMKKSGRFFPGI